MGKMGSLMLIFALAVGVLSSINEAVADFSLTAKIQRAAGKDQSRIKGLTFNSEEIELEQSSGESPTLNAHLEGQLEKRPGVILIMSKTRVKFKNPKKTKEAIRKFKIDAPVESEITKITLTAVAPTGDVEEEVLLIVFPGWKTHKVTVEKTVEAQKIADLNSRHFFGASLGISHFTYDETPPAGGASTKFSQLGATLKGFYSYRLSNTVDLGANLFFTPLGFASQLSGSAATAFGVQHATVRSLGANVRVGYAFPQVSPPWRISVMTGAYFITMFVSPGVFGFQNLMGPQMFPNIRYQLKSGDSVGGYFKFSPISTSFSVAQLSNREIAAGLSYRKKLGSSTSRRSIDFSADLSQLKIVIDGAPISTRSTSFGVGYSW
ncbi:MAG: hypothetical protein RJB38_1818 [Pseudomonadota bacterium]|jgi:hypothetical protein